jgi:DNA-binding NarL/FixJ family response regulator
MRHEHATARIRVVLVDDHPLIREGTVAALRDSGDLEVVGAVGDASSAVALVATARPDVVLLDVHLPDLSGVEVARWIHHAHPDVAVLVLTGYEDAGLIRALYELGARGYLLKTISNSYLIDAIRTVASGRLLAPPELPELRPTDRLTPREQEILRLVVEGRRNVEIAEALVVTVKTVEFHIGRLLKKFGVRSRSELIVKARQ